MTASLLSVLASGILTRVKLHEPQNVLLVRVRIGMVTADVTH